jgi:hypothetical protein
MDDVTEMRRVQFPFVACEAASLAPLAAKGNWTRLISLAPVVKKAHSLEVMEEKAVQEQEKSMEKEQRCAAERQMIRVFRPLGM